MRIGDLQPANEMLADHGQQINAGQRHLMRLQAFDPGLQQFAVCQRGEQVTVILALRWLTVDEMRCAVRRAAIDLTQLAVDHLAPGVAHRVRQGLEAVILLHHINQQVNLGTFMFLQIAAEILMALRVISEHLMRQQFAELPFTGKQPVVRYA